MKSKAKIKAVLDDYNTNLILDEVCGERSRQEAKWGVQNHEPLAWLPILAEEAGEVARALCDMSTAKDPSALKSAVENYREELIQVAAVAVAMVECLDRNK